MKIAMIGLGRMGANMTERLIKDGHEVVAFDLSEEARQAVEAKGAQAVESVEDAVAALSQPRVVWVMLPAGDITWSTIDKVAGLMAKGDIIIDGGNSNYKEFIEAAERTRSTGIELVDAGVSGGIWGLDNGYCLMVGGT
ncbi:MAG: NAD(P)-binding domain-containing protein, partial [Acidimicrobiales bacterium]